MLGNAIDATLLPAASGGGEPLRDALRGELADAFRALADADIDLHEAFQPFMPDGNRVVP